VTGTAAPATRLREFIERVWNLGEISAAREFLATAYTIHHDPGDPWEGRHLSVSEFEERVRVSRSPFPDQRFEIRDLIAQASSVAITWTWAATHRGDVPGFPATQQRITMSGATVYYFSQARLSGHWQIADRLGVFQQLSRNASVARG